jgi:hypothetical protein
MPTKYRAERNHKHFDWSKALAAIEDRLGPNRDEILRVLGFYDEYGNPNEWTEAERRDAEIESGLIIDEIAGLLAKAAAIAVGAGFKPVNRLLATLRAIAQNPQLVIEDRERIEPEALGTVASHYDRGDGVGKRPFDILGHSPRDAVRH